jgi:glycosyltransferase involved in cell wall biosynthesis
MSNSRIKVTFLGLRDIEGGQGGVENHVAHLAHNLAQDGTDVTVITRKRYSPQGKNSNSIIKTVPLPAPKSASTEAIIHSLLGVLYAAFHRPDILHIHAIGPSIVIPLARLVGLTVVATHHGKDYDREKWGPVARAILQAGEAMQAYLADGRITISSTLQHELAKKYPSKQFSFIPNGVPPVTPLLQSNELKPWGLSPERYILNVGRIVPEKRQIDLVDAFQAAG